MDKTTSTYIALQDRLYQLSNKLGYNYSYNQWNDVVHTSLKENNLEQNEPVPAWLINFIQCFVDGKEVEPVSFERPQDETNLERRWIGFINSVVHGEWEYDGESESVAFDTIRMQGIIDHEGNSYYVLTY